MKGEFQLHMWQYQNTCSKFKILKLREKFFFLLKCSELGNIKFKPEILPSTKSYEIGKAMKKFIKEVENGLLSKNEVKVMK